MKKVSYMVWNALVKYQEQSNLDIMPTQSELARMADTSRQCVNQWLMYMRRKGYIETNSSVYWKVQDIDRIRAKQITKHFVHVRDDIYASPTMRQMCLNLKISPVWTKTQMILDGALPIHGRHCKILKIKEYKQNII